MINNELSPQELAQAAAKVIAERTGVERHDIALTLGSGWGGAAELIGDVVCEIDASEIPGFTPQPLLATEEKSRLSN